MLLLQIYFELKKKKKKLVTFSYLIPLVDN